MPRLLGVDIPNDKDRYFSDIPFGVGHKTA